MLSEYTLNQLACEIRFAWAKVNFAAEPYLQAMECLNSINDQYGCDSGRSIVAYFLANASTWRGEEAKKMKAELNRRLKAAK
jgi:hypothetical protein